jgi:hypothetical protein
MKGWMTGDLKDRNFNKQWPNRNLMVLRDDIIMLAKKLEAKTPTLDTYPSLFAVRGASAVIAGEDPKGILIGAAGADSAITFTGDSLDFGQGTFTFVNAVAEDDDMLLRSLRGYEARAATVVVEQAEGAEGNLVVAYDADTFTLTITLGNTGGELAPAKNTLTLIDTAMKALAAEEGKLSAAQSLVFAYGDGANVLDATTIAASPFYIAEPTELYGEPITVELCGQTIPVTSMASAELVATVPAAMLAAAGAIDLVANPGDMLRGVLRVSGLAFEYYLLAGTQS